VNRVRSAAASKPRSTGLNRLRFSKGVGLQGSQTPDCSGAAAKSGRPPEQAGAVGREKLGPRGLGARCSTRWIRPRKAAERILRPKLLAGGLEALDSGLYWPPELAVAGTGKQEAAVDPRRSRQGGGASRVGNLSTSRFSFRGGAQRQKQRRKALPRLVSTCRQPLIVIP